MRSELRGCGLVQRLGSWAAALLAGSGGRGADGARAPARSRPCGCALPRPPPRPLLSIPPTEPSAALQGLARGRGAPPGSASSAPPGGERG